MKHSWWIATLAFLAVLPAAYAHTPLKSSEPASGATVAAPVRRITLEFGGEVRLTTVSLTDAHGTAQHIEEPPTATASKFLLGVADALAPGDYTITWRAVGADTHVVSGDIKFTVTPAASH